MEIIERAICELKKAEYNPRKLSAEQRTALCESLGEFGFTVPVVVNMGEGREGVIVGGHQRVDCWGDLGHSTVPVVEVQLSLEKERELNIRLNKNTGEWDFDLLEEFFSADELEDWGFGEEELGDIFAELEDELGETDPDDLPELGEVVVSVGEIWKLGDHRVLCGSSLDRSLVLKMFDGDLANCMWTDPPYNVDYQGGTGMKIQNDSMSQAEFFNFLRDAFAVASDVLELGAGFYVAHASKEVRNFWNALEANELDVRQMLTWVKDRFVMGRQDYQWKHEPILYGWKLGAAHAWYGGRKNTTRIEPESMDDLTWDELLAIVKGIPTDVVECSKPHKNDIHPTMKPIELIKPMVRNSTKPGGLVYDPFLGSGSTLIASTVSGRRCYGCELDPVYCTLLINRWQEFTGKKAERLDGVTFDSLREVVD